jgi:ornithine cyclodeaminase/alanine dehydrogenase-like protein (mu-crystallin family)
MVEGGEMLLLNREEILSLLNPAELMTALEDGFRALSSGQLDVPSRSQIRTAEGALLVMPASMPGREMSVKLVSVFHHNTNIPSHQALIALFDAQNGSPLALLDGTSITTLRTAACSMISVRLLARPDAKVAAVIGLGVQGQSHAKMLAELGRFEKIFMNGSNERQATSQLTGGELIQFIPSIAQAAAEADVICLCTSAAEPVLESSWLKTGVHITSVGYNPPGSELGRELAGSGRLFVESRRAFEPVPSGCAELQGLDPQLGTELGEVLLGTRPGRLSTDERTIYKSMGHAMEDAVAANLVYRLARQRGVGKELSLV